MSVRNALRELLAPAGLKEQPGNEERGKTENYAFFSRRRLIRPSTPDVRVMLSNSAR